jgi:hypothetical protein
MSLLPYKVFLNKLKGNGIVFFDNNNVYVQGLENEQVLLFQSKLEKPLFERPTKIKYIKNKKQTQEIIDKSFLQQLSDLTYVNYITSFSLSRRIVKKIKANIRKNNVTNLRLFTSNGNLRINLFDIRSFVNQTQFSRKNSLKLFSLPSVQMVNENFSRTLTTNSFLLLSDEDLNVNITENHVVIFDDEKNQCSYLLSDQLLVEPITEFINPKINKSVSFLFTNKIASRNTENFI